jgi:tryptophan synthase beta chain
VNATAYLTDEKAVFEAAKLFLESEGWLIAPESSYAVRGSIDEALKAERAGTEKAICMNISGHGFLDIGAYREKLSIDKRELARPLALLSDQYY